MNRVRLKSARGVALVLVLAVLSGAQPLPQARAESETIDPNLTVGLLLVVVGVLGWVAWTMEKEDRAESIHACALLPVFETDDSAVGFVFDPDSRDEARVIFTAGLAIGRRF